MELTAADIARLLPKRDENAHKGDFGRVLLLCGSRGYTGAPYFAAMGALRVGAGLVYLGVPESIYGIAASPAAFLARAIRSGPTGLKSLANSPSWGVRMVGAVLPRSISICRDRRVMPSASTTTGWTKPYCRILSATLDTWRASCFFALAA